MANLSKHRLIEQAYHVCLAIEKCGASPELTAASAAASELLQSLDAFFPDQPAVPGDFPPYQARVIIEFGQLEERRKALEAFMATGIFASLDDEDQKLMTIQLDAMRVCGDALHRRIERFSRPVDAPAS